jgi:hypothetical protein
MNEAIEKHIETIIPLGAMAWHDVHHFRFLCSLESREEIDGLCEMIEVVTEEFHIKFKGLMYELMQAYHAEVEPVAHDFEANYEQIMTLANHERTVSRG